MKHCLILKYRYTNEDKAVVVNKWAKFLLQQAPNEKGWYHNYRKRNIYKNYNLKIKFFNSFERDGGTGSATTHHNGRKTK